MKLNKTYFLGIGGIGMSAIARYFLLNGAEVHGYDRTPTDLTRQLESEGMKIHYTDDPSLIPDGIELVVLTPAIPKDHKEWAWFRENGYEIKKRSEVLGLISRNKRCVAVGGTHGKTTTSSMTTQLLHASGLKPSAFLGGIAENFHSNFLWGESDIVVVEADEYDRSFLQLTPDTAIITAIDPDHLDIYGTEEEVIKGFLDFAGNIRDGGTLLVFEPYRHFIPESVSSRVNVLSYGEDKGDIRIHLRKIEADGFWNVDLIHPLRTIEGLRLPMPGHHNMFNACAAISVAVMLGASDDGIRSGMEAFKGIKRRFEYIARTAKHILVDDYGHHPAELNSAIRTARTLFPERKLTGIFQPHLFTRTRDFVEGFAASLDELDEIILLPIYPAREEPIPGVTSEIIFNLMKNPNRKLIAYDDLIASLHPDQLDVVLTLGAGDIDKLVPQVANKLINA